MRSVPPITMHSDFMRALAYGAGGMRAETTGWARLLMPRFVDGCADALNWLGRDTCTRTPCSTCRTSGWTMGMPEECGARSANWRRFAGRWLTAGVLACGMMAVPAYGKKIDPALLAKAKAGDADAEFQIGAICAKQLRLRRAHYWYMMAAGNGNASAMEIVGGDFELARGVHRDYKQAAEWYRKGAEGGNLLAMIDAARIYEMGRGVHHDYQKAADWYSKAAELGDQSAELSLASLYETRLKDPEKAVEWYQKTAARGDTHSRYVLALHYLHGKGVAQDKDKAMGLLNLAALQGDADAQFMLGQVAEKETPLKQAAPATEKPGATAEQGLADAETPGAVYWYTKAAEQGNVQAQMRLSHIYDEGDGVAKDKIEAYFWASLALQETAAQHGNQQTDALMKDRDRMGASMSEFEMATVKAKLLTWSTSHPAKTQK